MKDMPSEVAGPINSRNDNFEKEWQNTEVNLNHLDLEADRNRINALKSTYIEPYVYLVLF